MIEIRDARPADAPALARLWARYLDESYELRDKVTPEILARDAFGQTPRFRLGLACAGETEVIAAAAWASTYDLHHFVPGVELFDLYVAPEHRGVGVAVRLIAHIAARGQAEGARFIKGSVTREPSPARKLYLRAAVVFPGDGVYVSGRAFRALASYAGASARQLCRARIERAWNYE
jgi:ribosomal protein S18 acetylase RimI-like enzyme